MAGMKRELAGDVIRPHLFAWSKVVLYPGVLFDLAFENGLGSFDTITGKIFPVRDHTDADHVIVLRDVPEPAFLRHECHGGRTLVQAGVAFRSFVIRPDRNLVEVRVLDAP